MVGALQAMLDRDVTGRQIDQPARNEERRDLARPALLQQQRGVGDAGKAADAGADHGAGGAAVLFGGGMPVGIVERLARRAHREHDEGVDLALVLRLHPLVGIERAVAALAAWNHAGDTAGEIGDVERIDQPGAALAVEDTLPARFNAATEWRHHPEARDHNPPHVDVSSPGFAAHNKKPVDRLITARPASSVARGDVSSSRSFREIWSRRRPSEW